MDERIIRTEYSDVMQKSYIDYAMSVIVSRALPDVRDGLKPVQRRTLYDMYELGIRYDRPYRKSARIVGDTMGKYHPHGDSSIYGALVVLAQDFKMGLPLVDGHGNFGSIEGDGAAAMRYTEARLQKITQEAFLGDLDKDIVNFIPNFDETEKEPEVLPVRIPNLLVNGSEGIAVGMTTSIPTHNLGEVIDATIALIGNDQLSSAELMEYIKGPDFPTGGIVVNQDELAEIYTSGTGKIRIRGRVETEDMKGGRQRLVVTEIPYTMMGANIGKFLNDVAALVESRKTTDITDISNQSSKEGIRIVIELRKGADPEYIKNLLYKKTRLEDTFGVNMLAVVDKRPEVLGLKQILEHNIDFQFDITTRKYQNLLDAELKKKEIQEGLIKATDVIDLIIEILRGSRNQKQAKDCLVNGVTEGINFKTKKSASDAAKLRFTEAQADAILQMRLYKLIGLEIDALLKDHKKTLDNIERYTDILNNYSSMARVIVNELEGYKKEFSSERKTTILNAGPVVLEEKQEESTPIVFLMDRFGYARCIDESVYEKNKEAADSENRFVLHCMSDGRLCVFTDTGKEHMLKISDVPFGRFRDKGTPIDNLCNYNSSQENYVTVMVLEEALKTKLLFATREGMVKIVPGSEFDTVNRKTVAATKLGSEDKLVTVAAVTDDMHVVLRTREGYFLRIPVSSISELKKNTLGVHGISLTKKDEVEEVYVIGDGISVEVELGDKKLALNRLKISERNTRGNKQRN